MDEKAGQNRALFLDRFECSAPHTFRMRERFCTVLSEQMSQSIDVPKGQFAAQLGGLPALSM
jgi:hypothetical protein